MAKAALYDQLGDAHVLYVADVHMSQPAAGEVVISVEAAGLNPFDSKVRRGINPSAELFPRRIGVDFAGTVAECGDDARYADGTRIVPGDAVLGGGHGTCAERVVVGAAQVVRRPESLSVQVAGGLYVAGLTALSCMVSAGIGAEDTVLIGGASGGVGLILVQLARAAGATVVGTASEANHDLLRSFGATPLSYGSELTERVRAIATPNAVVDCHGREALDAGVALGVPKTRVVGIADRGAIAELGVTLAEHEARTATNLALLAERAAAGSLHVPIAATFPLADVSAAYQYLDSHHPAGKILVEP